METEAGIVDSTSSRSKPVHKVSLVQRLKRIWKSMVTRASNARYDFRKQSLALRIAIVIVIVSKISLLLGATLTLILMSKARPLQKPLIDVPAWMNVSRTYPSLYSQHWDQVKGKVVICVKTGKEVQDRRLRMARATWMANRDIPHLLVVSDAEQEVWPGEHSINLKNMAPQILNDSRALSPEAQGINVSELGDPYMLAEHAPDLLSGGWLGDKDKNLMAFALAYERCPTCAVYLLVDDDTYVLLDNLAFNLLDPSGEGIHRLWTSAFEKAAYGGRRFLVASCFGYDDTGRDKNGSLGTTFAHGGAGILVNNMALSRMVPHVPTCLTTIAPYCYAGDMHVGLCLWKYTGLMSGARFFWEFQGEHLSWMVSELLKNNDTHLHELWNSSRRIITLHMLPEPEQAFMHEFEINYVDNQTFSNLKEFAYRHNITRAPRREWRSKKHGNKRVFYMKEYME